MKTIALLLATFISHSAFASTCEITLKHHSKSVLKQSQYLDEENGSNEYEWCLEHATTLLDTPYTTYRHRSGQKVEVFADCAVARFQGPFNGAIRSVTTSICN